MPELERPRAVWAASAFFVGAGVLEVVMGFKELPLPLHFWPVWETLGRGLLHFVLALGIWKRIALCRTLALIYCLAVLLTYAAVLGLALVHAPLDFPESVIVQSLYQIPSCVLLIPYLRSSKAALTFVRPLWH
jgi:hydrogenase/urease accessory protein HupE